MCRFFGVSRSGYYGYLKRMEIPAKDLSLAEKIRECQAECKSTYGYRRVHIWLERHGIYHNPKTVLRVMNKYKPSMSRRGNPYDTALAENFFSILKTECIHRMKIPTFEDARTLIDDYIFFYNHQHIQTKTKLTPLELRCQFIA